MNGNGTKYIRVVLPLALPKEYIYSVPETEESKIQFGIRVEVPLRRRFYSGIITEIMDDDYTPEYSVKNIITILDKTPVIDPQHYQFWKWIAGYYLCTTGEVMNVALPSGLKMSSETIIELISDVEINHIDLTDDEYMIYEALNIQNELTLKEIQNILDKKTVLPVINSLLNKQIINIREELIKNFKPKKQKYIKLTKDYENEDDLIELFDKLKRSKHQTNALLAFLQLKKNNKEVKFQNCYK